MTATILEFLSVRDRGSDGAGRSEPARSVGRTPETPSVDGGWLDRYMFDRESREELETVLVR
jgi:hypothetical protein